ncbi:MAG: hypothetical protein J7M26_01255 [Armatimonadetes bacterium]|nr:hypothetical protein [Armatimonadota bacterium]
MVLVVAGTIAFVAGLLLGEPAVVLDRATFVRDVIQFQLKNIEQGQGEARWSHLQAAQSVFRGRWDMPSGGLGSLAGVFALEAVVAVLGRRELRDKFAPFLLWLALYLGWLTSQGRHQHNWLMPALPLICVLVGLGADLVLQVAFGKRKGRPIRSPGTILAVLACVGVFLLPAFAAIHDDFRRTLPDTRVIATETFTHVLSSGTMLLLDGSTWTLPRIRESKEQLDQWLKTLAFTGRWKPLRKYLQYQKKALALWHGPTYRVIRLKHPWWGPGEKQAPALSKVAPKPPIYDYETRTLREYQQAGVEYVITTDDTLRRFDRPEFPSAARFYKELRSQGKLVMTVAPSEGVQGPTIFLYDVRPRRSSPSAP